MHPKYIIAGDPKTGKGFLRMGMIINHKDLIVGYEKVWGGIQGLHLHLYSNCESARKCA